MATDRRATVRRWRMAGTVLAALALGLVSCSWDSERVQDSGAAPVYSAAPATRAPKTIHFAVHPLYNPTMLGRAYQPLMDHLNAGIPGDEFVLEASRDYANYETKIRQRGPEFLLANPWEALVAMEAGYVVIASAGEPGDFKGIFVVRRDSGIRTVSDLRGKAVAYPSPTALAACIMPQWFLHTRGVDVNREIENHYVGSQESAILNALLGQTAAGATWPPPWRVFAKEHPGDAAQLRVIWETPPLINNAVMAREDIPPVLRERVRRLLLQLHQTPRGREALAGMQTARFLPAGDADYEPVRQFIARFEREVRPVEIR